MCSVLGASSAAGYRGSHMSVTSAAKIRPAGRGDDHAALAQITTRCEELKATRDLVREFADMLCHRRG